jgi:hypothetical protein
LEFKVLVSIYVLPYALCKCEAWPSAITVMLASRSKNEHPVGLCPGKRRAMFD